MRVWSLAKARSGGGDEEQPQGAWHRPGIPRMRFPLQGPLCLRCTQECDLRPTGGSGELPKG